MKAFFLTSLKIALGIVLSIVVLSVLAWGAYQVNEYRLERRVADLAEAQEWNEAEPKPLGVKIALTSKWRNGIMQYRCEIKGDSPALEAARKAGGAAFTFYIKDADGFDLVKHTIDLKEMIRTVGEDGKVAGAHTQGSTSVSADDYRRADNWSVSWRGIRTSEIVPR